jgi:nucleotide-binding universal stress UspA family protein
MYKHILIPTDGSPTAQKGVDAGIAFAREAKARITFFTAVPEYLPPSAADAAGRHCVSLWDHERISRDMAQAVLQPAAERARAAGVEADTAYAAADHPYQAIVDTAESRGCDLIVMSSHGRHGFAELWYGSETREVLTHSSIPTLVYR